MPLTDDARWFSVSEFVPSARQVRLRLKRSRSVIVLILDRARYVRRRLTGVGGVVDIGSKLVDTNGSTDEV